MAEYKTKTILSENSSKKQEGYTQQSAEATAKRNCKAVGGTWKNGKCLGGAA